jgi:hypothetical protein
VLVACLACSAISHRPAYAAPADCEPSVRVSGDPDVASAITARLAERGLGDNAAASCPAMEAHVERSGERLRVAVTDGYGRRSQREVRDTATAIALIESWARPEVVADALPGAEPIIDSPPAAATRAPAPATSATGLALIGGADYAGDGTTWARGGITACIALGPVCVGGRLDLATSTGWTTSGEHPRSLTAVAVTVELPRSIGRIAVVPGVGVGGGWATIDGIGPHMDQSEDVTSVRVLGSVALRVGLARRWALQLELGGEVEASSGTPATPGNLGRAGVGLRYGGW